MSELTATELRVLKLAARGMSTLESAYEAGRSFESVKTQRAQVFNKLGARNMAHAIAIGFRTGLLS